MEELIDFIEKLEGESFGGWSEKEKNAYLTACTSIKVKAKMLLEGEYEELEGTIILPENVDDISNFELFTKTYYYDFNIKSKYIKNYTLLLINKLVNNSIIPDLVEINWNKDLVEIKIFDTLKEDTYYKILITEKSYISTLIISNDILESVENEFVYGVDTVLDIIVNDILLNILI